jgi:uncharacterized HAD superfamily protein
MRIGLDFDGVISDCGRLKSQGAKILYGVEIPPEKFKKELVVDTGILTLEQYRHLQKQIYGTREIGLTMLPVGGVLEFVPKLQQEGYDLMVVTSRDEAESEIAREWMKQKNIELKLVGVSGGVSKTDACRGLDVYIDDDLDKLEPLVGVVPNRFLFSWGYNQHIEVPPTIAQRIQSWEHFYQEVSKLNEKSKRTQ